VTKRQDEGGVATNRHVRTQCDAIVDACFVKKQSPLSHLTMLLTFRARMRGMSTPLIGT
jgi:hypothetical protein